MYSKRLIEHVIFLDENVDENTAGNMQVIVTNLGKIK